MPVLMIGEVKGMTEEMYGGMVSQLQPVLQAAKGFISHTGGPHPDGGGWRVVEVWETEDDAREWFTANVEPNLPPGIVPDRTYHQLHTAFTK